MKLKTPRGPQFIFSDMSVILYFLACGKIDETNHLNDKKADKWILSVHLCTLMSIEGIVSIASYLAHGLERKGEYNGARRNRND